MDKKNIFYYILLVGTFVAYFFLFYQYYNGVNSSKALQVCVFKKVANIPCPSCGTTRALSKFLEGNFKEAILINPFVLIAVICFIVSPIGLLYDFIFKKNILYKTYLKIERFVNKREISIVLIILVICNWIWNIYKEL